MSNSILQEKLLYQNTLEMYQKLKLLIRYILIQEQDIVYLKYQDEQLCARVDDNQVITITFSPYVPFYCIIQLVDESIQITIKNHTNYILNKCIKIFYSADIQLSATTDLFSKHTARVLKYVVYTNFDDFVIKYCNIAEVINKLVKFN